jgi:hypothetical protein
MKKKLPHNPQLEYATIWNQTLATTTDPDVRKSHRKEPPTSTRVDYRNKISAEKKVNKENKKGFTLVINR